MPPHSSEQGVQTQISIFLHYYLGSIFAYIIENFEKYEIYKTLKQKVGRDLRGSGPHSEKVPRKSTLWVLRYGIIVENLQAISLNFQLFFSFHYTLILCLPLGAHKIDKILFIL